MNISHSDRERESAKNLVKSVVQFCCDLGHLKLRWWEWVKWSDWAEKNILSKISIEHCKNCFFSINPKLFIIRWSKGQTLRLVDQLHWRYAQCLCTKLRPLQSHSPIPLHGSQLFVFPMFLDLFYIYHQHHSSSLTAACNACVTTKIFSNL